MDTESLLRSLNAHKVRYVVIGATAFPVHGYARATLDVDIFIEATRENAGRTREALADFGYNVVDLSVEDLLTKKILIRESPATLRRLADVDPHRPEQPVLVARIGEAGLAH